MYDTSYCYVLELTITSIYRIILFSPPDPHIDTHGHGLTNIDSRVGRHWHILTHIKYHVDRHWQILTHMDTHWHVLTLILKHCTNIDTYWHALTRIDTHWQILTHIEPVVAQTQTLKFLTKKCPDWFLPRLPSGTGR